MGTTANPFDILPANLFNLFSTQGYLTLQRHYMAILLRLYALAELNRHGLSRELAVAEIIDYLKSEQAGADVAAAMATESGSAVEPDAPEGRALTGQKTEQDYAAYLLRRLADNGWVEREQHANYTETITLPDYAFTLLEALRTIQEQKPREFKGQLYTAYQLITSSRGKDFSPALALTQAYENVRQVVRGLSELNQNIRRYVERATRGRSAAELLRLQFDDYSRTLGPAYHALKTSDHVSRYRRDIIGKLQSWQRNADWLDRAAADLAAQGRFTPAQAEQEISHDLSFIIRELEGLDPLLAEIDRRHAQYLRTSLRQIRYQLVGANGNFKERLVSLARGLAALQTECGDASEPPAEMPPFPPRPVSLPDLHSFYTPPRRRAPFEPAAIAAAVLSPAELVGLRSAALQDVAQAMTPARVNQRVLGFFNGHRRLHVAELPPDVLADLPWLTTIIAYSHHPEVAYGLALAPGEPVVAGPYLIRPFQLETL